MELICPVQKYKWGKQGSESLVAQLKKSGDPDFKIDENEMYAELWMGAHPNGPAVLKSSRTPLASWLKTNEIKLGEITLSIYGARLPFLFKVLSVRKPLSIQVHPSQLQAEELHAKHPDIYDPHAKPELSIALSDFEILNGFRPIIEIRSFLELVPELTDLIGKSAVEIFMHCSEWEHKERLASIFSLLMHAPKVEVKQHLDAFMNRVSAESQAEQHKVLFDLVSRIHHYFPGDVGCFCVYFLNHMVLKPDEAVFLEANQLHAYISGDCIECMTESDNVVRAALTPKPRDVDTLCRILNYTSRDGSSQLFHWMRENTNCTLYKPPLQEFAVGKVVVKPGTTYDLKCRRSPSIFIVLQGHATMKSHDKMSDVMISFGKVFFVGAGEVNTIDVPHTSDMLILFQAFVNI